MAKQYFTADLVYSKPEPNHTLCWQHGLVTLQQRGENLFLVRYGKQVESDMTYGEACAKLGQALMHQMTCDGEIET